jgi:hypothetical protein
MFLLRQKLGMLKTIPLSAIVVENEHEYLSLEIRVQVGGKYQLSSKNEGEIII